MEPIKKRQRTGYERPRDREYDRGSVFARRWSAICPSRESIHHLRESLHDLREVIYDLRESIHYLRESNHYLRESMILVWRTVFRLGESMILVQRTVF